MRSRISSAALFVNVTAQIACAGTPCASRCAIRNVITRVLPEPAPASTSSGPPPWLAASCCGGLSLLRSTADTEPATLRIWQPLVNRSHTGVSYASDVDRYTALVEALQAE